MSHDDDTPDEITEPIDIFQRELSDEDRARIRRSRRDSEDPVTFGDLYKFAERQYRKERTDQAQNIEVRKLLERLETAHVVEARLAKIESLIAGGRKLAVLVVSAVLGSAGYAVKSVQAKGELAGETAIRIRHMEESVRRLEDHDYRSRYDLLLPKDSKP